MAIGESKELKTLLNRANARIMAQKREEFLHWAGRRSRCCIQTLSVRHTALRNNLLTVLIISIVSVKDFYDRFYIHNDVQIHKWKKHFTTILNRAFFKLEGNHVKWSKAGGLDSLLIKLTLHF